MRDPATQFIPVQQALSANDRLNRFITATSNTIWAVPPGTQRGSIGAALLT